MMMTAIDSQLPKKSLYNSNWVKGLSGVVSIEDASALMQVIIFLIFFHPILKRDIRISGRMSDTVVSVVVDLPTLFGQGRNKCMYQCADYR